MDSFPSFEHGAAVQAELALGWMDKYRHPHVILDHDLRIMWANRAALDAFLDFGDIEVVDNRLCMVRAQDQAEFQYYVQSADDSQTSICFPCEDGGVMIFRGVRIDDANGRADGRACVGIEFFKNSALKATCCLDSLERAFGLTPGENRILHALVNGMTAEEIATSAQLSLETVRTHIRRIYAKMQVNSREGLFARLQPFITLE